MESLVAGRLAREALSCAAPGLESSWAASLCWTAALVLSGDVKMSRLRRVLSVLVLLGP